MKKQRVEKLMICYQEYRHLIICRICAYQIGINITDECCKARVDEARTSKPVALGQDLKRVEFVLM